MKEKVINSKWFYFVIIFLFMLVFNFLTPYIMDDYQLMFNYSQTKRISSLSQIFVELYHMYFNWGGRMVAHFFAYTFLALPKWIFNIVNSIVYVLNVYFIYFISKDKNKNQYFYLLLIHMMIFVFFPVIGQVFFWLDGSCNYSFTLLIQLFFIYKILHIHEVSRRDYLIYFIISVLAGMCNENSSLSLIVFLLLYMIYDRSHLKLKIVSFISLIGGYLFLFLAPGNYVRMKMVSGNTSIFTNFFQKLSFLFMTFWPLFIGVLFIIFVFYLKNKKKGLFCFILYISSLVAFFSMMASPQLNIRSFTMPVIYLFIICFTILFHVEQKQIQFLFPIILSVLFGFYFIQTSYDYSRYYHFMSNREKTILSAVSKNKKEVSVEIYPQSNNCRVPASCELKDILKDKDDFPNYFMSKYYGINIYGYSK